MTAYTSQYPTQDTDHVKATSKYSTSYWPYYTTDPAKALTGSYAGNQWIAANLTITNQRFHIDLGSGYIIRRIYYENSHYSGLESNTGAKNFTLMGSNDAGAFAELTYATDTNWTTIGTYQFDQHAAANSADPKYITVNNSTEYRYYALKISDCWGASTYMGIRRVELQTEDGFTSAGGQVLFFD